MEKLLLDLQGHYVELHLAGMMIEIMVLYHDLQIDKQSGHT